MATHQLGGQHAHSIKHDGLVLLGFLVASHAAGLVGLLVGNQGFYNRLAQPSWAPPPWVFGPVWSVLYTCLGVAAFLIWRAPASDARSTSLGLFWAQLLVNAAWTPVFFGAERIGLALAVIVVLLVLIALSAWQFMRVSRVAAGLFVPYFVWVAFATALNAALCAAN